MKSKQIKSKKIKYVIIIATYIFISFYVVWEFLNPSYANLTGLSKSRMATAVLDETPFVQSFEANYLVGIRLYLTNEYNISEGVVLASLYDDSTGQVIYDTQIDVTDIPNNGRNSYIDLLFQNDIRKENGKYALELYAVGDAVGKIKTYICGADSENSYTFTHGDDSTYYNGKMLYFGPLEKVLPLSFFGWMFLTGVLLFCFFFNCDMPFYQLKVRASIPIRVMRLWLLIVIGLFGTGVVDLDSNVLKNKKIIDIDDESNKDIITLGEHSDYSYKFTVKENNLTEIALDLYQDVENTANFTVSIKKGEEDVIASIQSNELENYVWNIKDLELQKGEEYDLCIYTGFINYDEESPSFIGAQCVYGDDSIKIFRVALFLGGIVLVACIIVFLEEIAWNKK